MNLDFNNILKNIKENNFVQNFIKELSEFLEQKNNEIVNNVETNNLEQKECLYQVVEIGTNYAFLQSTSNNQISKKTDIPKEILEKIENDTVLQYKNGEYSIEEELTQKFMDSLIGIKEYKTIKNNFEKHSNILKIDQNMTYEIQEKRKDYCILKYGHDEKNTIEVPNELIPFWANEGEKLYYKNGQFNRK